MKARIATSALLVCATLTTLNAAEPPAEPLARRAREVLNAALAAEKAFVKVHAAEALIALGEKDEPRRVFRAELRAANELRPYRIGVWRVLAMSSDTPQDRAEWIARTEGVVLDATATDRLHAIESLGKLGHAPRDARVRAAAETMAKSSEAEAVFPLWVLHLAGDRTAVPAIAAALGSDDPIARLRAAYVLHRLNVVDSATRAALARAAVREPPTAIGYPIVLGAAVALDANPTLTSSWIGALEQLVNNGSAGARYHACQILMHRYAATNLARLAPLLEHPDGDARIGAAWAILHVTAKRLP